MIIILRLYSESKIFIQNENLKIYFFRKFSDINTNCISKNQITFAKTGNIFNSLFLIT